MPVKSQKSAQLDKAPVHWKQHNYPFRLVLNDRILGNRDRVAIVSRYREQHTSGGGDIPHDQTISSVPGVKSRPNIFTNWK